MTTWTNVGWATPVEQHEDYLLKRDDLFAVAGVRGGKARTCWNLAQGATGLVTAGFRDSRQHAIVAAIGAELGVPVQCHTASGEDTRGLEAARGHGAQVIQHRPGYGSVLASRAKTAAQRLGYVYVPLMLACDEAVAATAAQVRNIERKLRGRIVVPVGSGMSMAGVIAGVEKYHISAKVLGVVCGTDPSLRLAAYTPLWQQQGHALVWSTVPYNVGVKRNIGNVLLNGTYEAKCVEHLMDGDLLWLVGP